MTETMPLLDTQPRRDTQQTRGTQPRRDTAKTGHTTNAVHTAAKTGLTIKVQLGMRYEGQLNHMAEPIPHPVRPLVRSHDTHHYLAADPRAETDRLTLIGADAACASF